MIFYIKFDKYIIYIIQSLSLPIIKYCAFSSENFLTNILQAIYKELDLLFQLHKRIFMPEISWKIHLHSAIYICWNKNGCIYR